jgi:hypothetical protein
MATWLKIAHRFKTLHLTVTRWKWRQEDGIENLRNKIDEWPNWLALPFLIVVGVPAAVMWFILFNLAYFCFWGLLMAALVVVVGSSVWLLGEFVAPLFGIENLEVSSFIFGVILGCVLVCGVWKRGSRSVKSE